MPPLLASGAQTDHHFDLGPLRKHVEAPSSFFRAQTLPKGQARDTAIEAARSALEESLYDLANNLEQTSDVTEVMLATTGFDLRKASSRSNEPRPFRPT